MTDPSAQTYRNARREARFVLLVWLIALIWTVSYCYLHGYPHEPDSWLVRQGLATPVRIGPSRSAVHGLAAVAGAAVVAWEPGNDLSAPLPQTWGLPSWVFWGIAVPAAICSAVTLAYGLFGMADDALGAEGGEAQP